jgi:NlpC/P60 family
MGGSFRLRAEGAMVLALSSAVLLASGSVAVAQSAGPHASGSRGCPAALNSYKPRLAGTYLSSADAQYILYVTKIKETAGGELSGEFDVNGSLSGAAGTFTGTISHSDISVKATFASGNGLGISTLSFTGQIGCFLTKITTDSLTTSPPNLLGKKWTVTSACPDPESLYPTDAALACHAEQLRDDLGAFPYVNGGGHGEIPGPTRKKVDGKLKLGLDCSGYTRWVYYVAFGVDVLTGKHWGTTADQWKLTKRVPEGKAGELVFFTKANGTVTHVGIDLGDGFMLDEPHTGSFLRAESISGFAKKDHEKVVFRHLGLG